MASSTTLRCSAVQAASVAKRRGQSTTVPAADTTRKLRTHLEAPRRDGTLKCVCVYRIGQLWNHPDHGCLRCSERR